MWTGSKDLVALQGESDAISCSMPVDAATEEETERVARAVVAHATALAATLRRHGIR